MGPIPRIICRLFAEMRSSTNTAVLQSLMTAIHSGLTKSLFTAKKKKIPRQNYQLKLSSFYFIARYKFYEDKSWKI